MTERRDTLVLQQESVEFEVLDRISAERIMENMFLASLYSISIGQDQLYPMPSDLLEAMFSEETI